MTLEEKATLWTLKDIAAVTGGDIIGNKDIKVSGISMDSRSIKADDAFIAIDGSCLEGKLRTAGQDGHDYLFSAVSNGAIAAIVQRPQDCNIPLVVVDNTFHALQKMAEFRRNEAKNLTSIAVTGSVGKTTLRDMISGLLRTCAGDGVYSSQKSYNNALGVPFTLCNMPLGTRYGIFEIGMNHAEEIEPLSNLVKPDISVISWISEQHIENFDNGIQGIIDAKSEIFTGMNPDGTVILPRDNPHYDALLHNAQCANIKNIFSFGTQSCADAHIISMHQNAEGTEISADIMGQTISYFLSVPGRHMAMNSLAAILAAKIAGEDIVSSLNYFSKLTAIEGRGKQHQVTLKDGTYPVTVIDDSYNAAPAAMVAAIEVLGMKLPQGFGRRIAMLGNMAELGAHSEDLHKSLLQPLIHAKVDLVYCCGKDMIYLYEVLPDLMRGGYYETSQSLNQSVKDIIQPGDIVLVKGSLGSNMKIIVQSLIEQSGQ